MFPITSCNCLYQINWSQVLSREWSWSRAVMQEVQQTLQKSCFRCDKKISHIVHVESNYILQLPKYLIIIINRLSYINNNVTKDIRSMPMDITIVFGPHKFSLQATIDNHGSSMYCGNDNNPVNCSQKHDIKMAAKSRSLKWLVSNLLYCICSNIWIDYLTHYGLEEEDGSLISFMALARPPHPLRIRSMNKHRNLGLDDVFPPNALGSGP